MNSGRISLPHEDALTSTRAMLLCNTRLLDFSSELVGRVLDQRMLEGVHRLGRYALPEDQL